MDNYEYERLIFFQMGEEERLIRAQERESLRLIIQQWNSNRLDLFEISEPDEVSHHLQFLNRLPRQFELT